MFQVDPEFTHLEIQREQVLALVQSINAISVKVPGFQAALATAYVVGWDQGDGTAAMVIYLHYNDTATAAVYVPEPRVFPITGLPQVSEEAAEFLESMGFMLDDSAFGTKPVEEQERIINQTPLFHKDLARFAKARESVVTPEPPAVEAVEVIEVAPESESAAASVPAESSAKPNDRAEAVGRLLMSF